jgi:CP family cyanate transporter-like MFS transporter
MPDSTARTAEHDPGTTRRPRGYALFIVGIVALGFNLRASITSLPPVFPELSDSLHLSTATLSVLAAAPVLCFAVFSPLAAPLARRFGEERVLLAATILLVAGLLLRSWLPGLLLFPGTIIAAGAIAFLNVLFPSLVKRRYPRHAGLLIGTYLVSLCSGAILGSLIAVPVFQATGGSVPAALGLWALPAAMAVLVWLPQRRHRTTPGSQTPPGQRAPGLRSVSRHLLAWQVMAYMGLQSLIYYAALSWLPILFRDRGSGAVNAGTLLALMNLGNAVTALLAPVLAHRVRDQRMLVAVTTAATAAGLIGVWFAPLASAPVWVILLGFGQGASLALAIYFTTARAPDPATAGALSGFVQGAGYLVAAVGPLAIGLLHSLTGSWTVPVVALLLIAAGQLVTGWPAGRDKILPAAGQVPTG